MGPPVGKIDMGWSGVVQPAAFLFFLVFGSFFQEEMLFLDKVCIHQTDEALRQKGIDSIGLYLYNSRTMLVLWSPEYFSRLWCCFEMGVFLDARPQNALEFLPLFEAAYSFSVAAIIGFL